MRDYQRFSTTGTIIGFHSCDKEVGLKILNGYDELIPSNNPWDWLGEGVYFWEQNPLRALEYAVESSQRKQFNKIPIKTPFILGAIIDLGECLNLTEADSLELLGRLYLDFKEIMEDAGQPLPENKGANRELDCAVIEYIHQTNEKLGVPQYDTVRCAFPEGKEIYPNAGITSRLHLQVCVRNPECIKGYFLPRPLEKFNPYLEGDRQLSLDTLTF